MDILSAKDTSNGDGFIVTLVDGTLLSVPNNPLNRYHRKLMDWVTAGNTIAPADPLPSPPTKAEIYDRTIKNSKLLKVLILALNDGTFVPGDSLTNAQLKTFFVPKI